MNGDGHASGQHPGASGRQYGLALLAGLMLGCSFPPSTFGILACFGLVPLLIAMSGAARLRDALKLIYVAMFVFHLITLNWTGGYVHANDPYMMIAGGITMIVHPLFYFLPLGLYYFVRRNLGEPRALIALPFLWVAYEYSHSLSEWSFPWLTIGNSQSYDLARIQFIAWTGVWGLSFWILIINCSAYMLYLSLARRAGERIRRESFVWLLLLTALYVLPALYGRILLSGAPRGPEPGKGITIGIVQSNVDPWEKWSRSGQQMVDLYLGMTRTLLAGQTSPRPQLVLWPETAIPDFLLLPRMRPLLERMKETLDTLDISILTGIEHAVFYGDPSQAPPSARTLTGTGARYDTFNAAAFIQPGSADIQWYGKMKMVPLAERIPYADMFAFLDFMRWGVGIGGWQVGPDTTVFVDRRTGARFSTIICYESVYPGFVAAFVRKGAEFLTLITIDSWWGKMSGAYQHRQFAVFRAVENRRWITRCAVGGISCFIDPYGRSYDDTGLFTRTTLCRTIGRSDELTFYTRHGDWMGDVMVCMSGLFIAAAFGQKFINRKRKKLWNTSI